MNWEKYAKNVISRMLSALLASFILVIVTQLWLAFSGTGGGEAVTWLTR
ncbi:hypothetical protein [Mesobacillus sp.]